ncbi:MAG: PKD domain-containing protein [Bacteroidetes bacterium]|nr:PKD domain-containing protein [Bacteroidota bacterium]
MRLAVMRILTLVALITGFAGSTLGSHYMGVDITYECIDPCTYRIYHKSYYDCSGSATQPYLPPIPTPAPSIGFTGNPAGCVTTPQQIGGWVFVHNMEVTPVCPSWQAQTACNGGALLNGVTEGYYYSDFNFCTAGFPACNTFNITWYNCCRNNAITSGATGAGIFTGNTIINPGLLPCNNSPAFINPPVPYICAGQPFTFNQGAYDPDGDSLSYALIQCFSNSGLPVTYSGIGGYSPVQPLGNTWNVTVNPLTGDVSMIPNPTGAPVVGVLCLEVSEWRNGVKIGSVVRDIQITVVNLGCTGANPTTGGIQNATINGLNATPLSFNEINTCVGLPLCFDIPTINPTAGLTYTMSWDQNVTGATFVDANNPIVANTFFGPSPTAQFCWTPNQTGTFSFVLTLKDDNCPINGLNQYSMIIYVNDNLQFSAAIGDNPNCNLVNFAALPDPNADPLTLTYTWTGAGGVTGSPTANDSAFGYYFPSPGVYPWQLTIQDSFGCAITIEDTVTILNGATIDGGSDISICSGYSVQLGSAPITGQTYNWSPGAGLNNSTLANPTFTLTNNGTNPDTTLFLATADNGTCQTFDEVRVVVYPTPAVSITPASPQVCLGDSVTLTATGGNTFQWSTGETTNSIKVAPSSNASYSVVTIENGCTSSPVFVTVDVIEPPIANISGDLLVCEGDMTILTGSGATTYSWSNGAQANTATFNNITQNTPVYMIPFQQGCPGDTVEALILTHEQPVADFNAPEECEGRITSFTDLSSVVGGSIVKWNWNFQDPSSGNANFANTANPAHTFTAAGSYFVELKVTSNAGCEDTHIEMVEVAPIPDVDFSFTNVCQGLDNQFTDLSTIAPGATITQREWDFGDGSPTTVGPSAAHAYSDYGYFNVTLTVTSDNGCENSFTKTIFVHPNPIADFDVLSACQDSVVLVANGSIVPGVLDFIQSYTWNFGDPTSANNTSTRINPTHVYPDPGVYNISLTITTENGCVSTISRDLGVYTRPNAEFAVDGSCEKDRIRFTDLSTVGGPISTPIKTYFWDFGDSTTSDLQSPHHFYTSSGPGTYRVVFGVGTSQYCVDTVIKDVVIHPNPVSIFKYEPVCVDDSMSFTNLSTISSGLMNYQWNFGDNTPGTSLDNPKYLYSAPGTYNVSLLVTSNEGCTSYRGVDVDVYALPDIPHTLEETVCFGDIATLQAVSSPDDEILWYYNLTDEEPFHTGNSFTTHPLPYGATYYVESVSSFGCTNTRIPITAHVFSAESAQIVSTPEVINLPLGTVEFSVASTANIEAYSWNLSDGSFSDEPSPVHEYEFPGVYEISVSLIDENGCELTLTKVIEVKKLVNISTPSAFSPNGDGINDLFRIGHFNLSQFSIQIFNRWGQMVFESNNPDFEWNGRTIKGNMVHEGVYVYKLRATDFDGNTIEESRSVTVIK